MKRSHLLLPVILGLLLTVCTPVKDANILLRKFTDEQVPDRRERIFDISVKKEGRRIILTGETDSQLLKDRLLAELRSFRVDDRIVLLPDSSIGGKTYGLISPSVANMRATPAYTAELVTQGLMGNPVKILKRSDGWFLIQTPDQYISWADASAFIPLTEDEFTKWKNSQRVIITKEYLSVKAGPEPESEILSDLVPGNILEIIEKNNKVIHVQLPDGRQGFIPSGGCEDFRIFSESAYPDKESMVSLARSYTGRPYLWGGMSTKAMDCSGLIRMIYFMHGILLARDASLQARHGESVSPGENFDHFETGDLLFFGNNKDRITHVAFSLGGSAYIHASGTVKENSFDPSAYNYSKIRKNAFIKSTRVIGQEGTEGIVPIKNHPWYW
jgi:gamma-D-glutamyl-L-lysine dipeptidyl-peptidase